MRKRADDEIDDFDDFNINPVLSSGVAGFSRKRPREDSGFESNSGLVVPLRSQPHA